MISVSPLEVFVCTGRKLNIKSIFPDLEILVQQMKFVRSLKDIEPWKSGVLREVAPGVDCTSDEDLRGTQSTVNGESSLTSNILFKTSSKIICRAHGVRIKSPSFLSWAMAD